MFIALAASVERPWERAVTANNVPFYIKYVQYTDKSLGKPADAIGVPWENSWRIA